MNKTIEIKELGLRDASLISNALLKEKSEYLKHFTPFEFSVESFAKILSNAKKDRYFGIYVSDELAGFYMLRGFDEGYEIPAYGVWISSEFSNKGLSKLTLYHAFSFCKINSIKNLMLKVHPDNKIAKALYESLGFIKVGVDEKNDNIIYHKALTLNN
ncbi:MAG: GNAT family N-acetyltransferase [Ignavibacteriaceae bacterium]|nr:GNAT family N-acetyltransferase [Ignavibacteria bacterium]NNL22103.1 GNAT family N-acetyltransferase [Ignavibacteriaceae bacterium]